MQAPVLSRSPLRRFVIGITGAALVVLGFLIFQRLSPSRPVTAVVNREVELWNANDLPGLYATFSPRLQQICPLPAFEQLASQGRGVLDESLASNVQFNHVHVKLSGETADVTGQVVVAGQVVYQLTDTSPAQYVHTPDGWLLDSIGGDTGDNACASGVLPGS
jgi:hypothetical protein